MNIIQKVTWKSLWCNKKRTVVTILGVAICVAMLTSISIIAASLHDALLQNAIYTNGTNDFVLTSVANKKVDKLVKDKRVASSMRLREVGYANVENENLHVLAIDIEEPQLRSINIVKGRLPKKADEIAINEAFRKIDHAKYHIGDTITLPLYKVHYEASDVPYIQKEVRDEIGSYSYTITGFVTNTGITNQAIESVDRTTQIYAFTNYDTTPIHSKNAEVAIRLKDVTNFEEQYKSMIVNYESGAIGNTTLQSLHGVDSKGIYTSYIPAILVLICIILIGGVSLIYNAFSISLSERSRYLGMLSSVGATKKQKRNSVLYEVFIIGVIAIPLGLFMGIVGISITLSILNPYIASVIVLTDVPFKTVIDWRLLLFTIVFSILVLLLSAWIPAHRASKITAISAIQQTNAIKISKKHGKRKHTIRKLFGVEAELGLKNIKRNRSRYRSTLSSLIICIALFMCVQFFSTTMSDTTGMMMNYTDADILLNFSSFEKRIDFNQKEIRELRALPSVKKSVLYGEVDDLYIKDTAQLSEEAMTQIKRKEYGQRISTNLKKDDMLRPNLTLQILSDQDFEQYCKEIGSDPNDFDGTSSSIIVVNTRTIQEEVNGSTTYRSLNTMNVNKQDEILCYATNIKEENKANIQPIALRVAQVANKAPSFNKKKSSYVDLLFVCNYKSYVHLQQDMLAKGYGSDSPFVSNPFFEMQLIAKDVQQLQEDVKQVEPTFPYAMSVNNIAQERIKHAQKEIFINTMLYGFVILIALICMANIMNTLSTSIELRKREFAMIKSIGITKRKFYKMICFETFFYGIKALFYGIPLGMAGIYVLYSLFTSRVFTFQLLLHWQLYGWMMVAVLALLFLTMLYSLHKIRKDNIVETIRLESI